MKSMFSVEAAGSVAEEIAVESPNLLVDFVDYVKVGPESFYFYPAVVLFTSFANVLLFFF